MDTVIIDGGVVMAGRRFRTVDEREVFALAREHARRVIDRAGIDRIAMPTTSDIYD